MCYISHVVILATFLHFSSMRGGEFEHSENHSHCQRALFPSLQHCQKGESKSFFADVFSLHGIGKDYWTFQFSSFATSLEFTFPSRQNSLFSPFFVMTRQNIIIPQFWAEIFTQLLVYLFWLLLTSFCVQKWKRDLATRRMMTKPYCEEELQDTPK